MKNKMFSPCVIQVVPTNDYKVFAYFNDGSIKCVDIKPLIKPQTVFEKLEDINIFKSKLTIINDTVAWDFEGKRDRCKCVDLDPDVIFELPNVDEVEVLEVLKG